MHPEQREAVAETHRDDLLPAVEFLGHLSMLVKDDQFDQSSELRVEAVASTKGEGSIKPIQGFRS